MGAFDFVTVIIAIVLGLGLTHLLAAGARLLRFRDRVEHWYAPSLLWGCGLFIVILQHWWSEYGHRNIQQWTFAEYFWSILIPAELYVLSYIIVPVTDATERIDLLQEYRRAQTPFFVLLLALLATTLAQEFAFSGGINVGVDLAFKCVFAAIAVVALAVRIDPVQQAIAIIAFVLLLLYVSTLFGRLPA